MQICLAVTCYPKETQPDADATQPATGRPTSLHVQSFPLIPFSSRAISTSLPFHVSFLLFPALISLHAPSSYFSLVPMTSFHFSSPPQKLRSLNVLPCPCISLHFSFPPVLSSFPCTLHFPYWGCCGVQYQAPFQDHSSFDSPKESPQIA